MATIEHESEIIQVQGLKAALKDGGNKGLFNEATCSTAAATAAKTVDAPTSFSLVSGATIIVKFTEAITVASATLKVGSTDAKPIYYRGAALAKNLVAAGDRLILRYNGTQYDILGHINTDTNTKVTSVANHYAPAADSDSELSASASGATASWGIDVVKGVQVQRDAKGHVTGITVTSGKIPSDPSVANTVTGSGLTADKIVLGNGNSTVKTSSKGITTTNPSANSTNDDLPTSKAVWGAIADGIAANDAMVYKGTIAGGSTGAYGALTAAANRGWTYKVSTAGKIDGIAVEVGDMIICNTDSTAAATSSNYSTIAAKWDYIQANADGVLFKSSNTFTNGHVLVADSTAGKVKDSGYTIGKSVPSNAVFTDTTYSVMGASGSSHASGLVPDPGATAGTSKYLREDGTWAQPTDNDTTYKININGTDQGGGTTSLGTVYAPTTAGTQGQMLIANASGIPSWGSKPSYTLAEVGATMSASAISANTSSSCSITGAANAGKSETIIYTNSSGADLTVTVPTTYSTPDGAAIELTCPDGGYCEVNYINIGGTIYARGL